MELVRIRRILFGLRESPLSIVAFYDTARTYLVRIVVLVFISEFVMSVIWVFRKHSSASVVSTKTLLASVLSLAVVFMAAMWFTAKIVIEGLNRLLPAPISRPRAVEFVFFLRTFFLSAMVGIVGLVVSEPDTVQLSLAGALVGAAYGIFATTELWFFLVDVWNRKARGKDNPAENAEKER